MVALRCGLELSFVGPMMRIVSSSFGVNFNILGKYDDFFVLLGESKHWCFLRSIRVSLCRSKLTVSAFDLFWLVWCLCLVSHVHL